MSDVQGAEADSASPEAIVLQAFQRHLGLPTNPLPTSHLREDLNINSLMLVTVLFDLEAQLSLDLQAANIDLDEIETVGDIVSLFQSLLADRAAAG